MSTGIFISTYKCKLSRSIDFILLQLTYQPAHFLLSDWRQVLNDLIGLLSWSILRHLKKKKYRIYLTSNSIFSFGESTKSSVQ